LRKSLRASELRSGESAPDLVIRVPPLAARATVGAMWVGIAQIVRNATVFLTSLVVARILTPSDYGVMAMVAPIAAFLLLFQDLGLSQSVIQARIVQEEALQSLFWVNMVASLAIALILILTAPLVSFFYGDGRVGYVAAASAFTVIATGSALQHSALLSRGMRFKALGLIDIASSCVALLATIVGSLTLHSYWALWIGQFVGVIVQSVLLWKIDPWRPTLVIQFRHARDMARFGSGVTGFNLVNFFVRNLDNVLVAKFSGATAIGLYDQSYKLMMAPMVTVNGPLARVIMPVLSRLQDEPERYRRAFLLAARVLLFVLTPGLAIAVALSDRLMPFLFGDKWAAAGQIFFWLSLTGLIQPLINATGWLFLSSGRTQSMFLWGLLSAAVTVIGFIIGLHWGAVGVAAALFWTALFKTPVLFAWCVRGTSVRTFDLYLVLIEPTIGAGISFLLAHVMEQQWSTITTLFVSIPTAYLVTIGAHCVTSSGRQFITSIVSLARQFVSSQPWLQKKFGFLRP
jgi:PST family polysaccharide transporter